ncbi:MAG TPA: hypothetical protein VK671_01120 [Mucilaginibacter sp.]|jgi:hypothetical protein|nr:hypothetical protein [Mucilaginibacter sp.]
MFNRPDYALLLYLEKHGVTEETNVSPFIADHYKNKSTAEKKIDNEDDLAVKLLRASVRLGYIYLNFEELDKIQSGYKSNHPIPTGELPYWFDTCPVTASLTIAGMEHLNQIKINQQISISNQTLAANSSEQTIIFNWQKWFLAVTMVTSLVTTCVSIQTCNQTSNHQTKEIDSLKSKVQQLDSTNQRLKTEATNQKHLMLENQHSEPKSTKTKEKNHRDNTALKKHPTNDQTP